MAEQVALASTDVTTPRRAPRRNLWREMWKARWAYVFISPFFVLYTIFGIYPLIFSFVLGFTSWNGNGPLEFIGLANYTLLFKDKVSGSPC